MLKRTFKKRWGKSLRGKRLAYRRRKPGTGRFALNVKPYTRQLFPKRVSTKLMWSEVTDVVTAVNTPWFILYSGNGMNDPNKTSGSTHQPMGFDQMNALYINYLVTGVKVIIEGVHTAAGGHQVSIQAGTVGTGFATAADAINEYRQAYSIVTSNQRPWKFKKYFSNPAILGIKRSQFDEPEYWGQTAGTTNPTYGTELYLQIRNLDASEQINSQVTVTFVYYVTFFNNQIIGQS